jgi:hypothetical protein
MIGLDADLRRGKLVMPRLSSLSDTMGLDLRRGKMLDLTLKSRAFGQHGCAFEAGVSVKQEDVRRQSC